ncbi:MAG: hypothetical protein HYX53_03695 [Chloroflexi bacterium]|nr:hypothetical protein [Chloroflexota bacterium]
MVANSDIHVRFEGFGVAPEIWGAMQANYLITAPGHHARETAVLLNEPAAAFLAELLGQPDTEDFRRNAARHVGRMWVERLIRNGERIAPAITISRQTLEADPEFLANIRASLNPAAA